MKDKLLIIFLRAPELGRVKTRLAATIGDEKALELYELLVSHTLEQASRVDCTKETWYADVVPKMDAGVALGSTSFQQHGKDLGRRMEHAFEKAFAKGLERVLIIGTDCPGLTAELIQRAFSELDDNDAVFGPAQDGGYYLLGLRRATNELFRNKAWSTDTVLRDSIADLERLDLKYSLLPELIDVDTETDLARAKLLWKQQHIERS